LCLLARKSKILLVYFYNKVYNINMDASIKTIYSLVLKKDARVTNCIEYPHYYTIHLEWNTDDYFPEDVVWGGWEKDWIQTKVVALIKPRR